MNDKLLKGIEYSFYLMLLLYLVGKSFEILTILIDVLFVIYSIKNRNLFLEFYKKFKEVFIAFGMLILYFLVQSLFSNDISIALKHSFGVSRFVILLFAIMYVFNKKEKIKNVMIISFIALFIVNMDSLYQFIFKVDIFGMPMYSGDKRLTAWTDMPVVNLYSGQFFGLLLASIFILKDNYRNQTIFLFQSENINDILEEKLKP